MRRFIEKEKGSSIFTVSVFVSLLLCFMVFFSIVVSKNTINLIIHEAKSDLYLINRNAIFAIQRDLMGEDIESLDEEELEILIKEGMKSSWGLNNRLSNGDGIIKSAQIVEVDVLEEGDWDSITKKEVSNLIVHTVVKIKIVPIIFASILKESYEFNLHEDFKIEKMNLL